jgi:VIT1/CCC1 family predicted Fe2+/Mn2+ transporter
MRRIRLHPEGHLIDRIGWLRATVLGANDATVSTASLIVGAASSAASSRAILTAGVSALAAGVMSMAGGEYVSVSLRSDTDRADLRRERKEPRDDPASELEERANIYVKRGLHRELADQAARQLMVKDAPDAHARDELRISEITTARLIQAAFTSAASFARGAVMPLLARIISPAGWMIAFVSIASLGLLATLGAIGARVGRARIATASARVAFRGALAVTAGVGALTGVAA